MAGVGIRVTKWNRANVGVGKEAYLKAKGSLKLGRGAGEKKELSSAEKVKALGEKIIKEETVAAAVTEAVGKQPTPTIKPTKAVPPSSS